MSWIFKGIVPPDLTPSNCEIHAEEFIHVVNTALHGKLGTATSVTYLYLTTIMFRTAWSDEAKADSQPNEVPARLLFKNFCSIH